MADADPVMLHLGRTGQVSLATNAVASFECTIRHMQCTPTWNLQRKSRSSALGWDIMSICTAIHEIIECFTEHRDVVPLEA
jgi:hypothetical protein